MSTCPECNGPAEVWADNSGGVTVNFACDNPSCASGKPPWDTPRPTPPTLQERIDQATARGKEAGHAAGSWVIDGNTSAETAAAIVKGYEDGDPETMDMQPAAISNYERDGLEHPQDVLGDLLYDNSNEDQSYGELADDQAIVSAYEEAFTEAYWAEVIQSAKDLLQPDLAGTTAGWCCSDCMMLLANGETPPEMSEEETTAYLATWDSWEGHDITPGRMLGALECDCWDWDTTQHRDSCERLDFTWSRCDICQRPGQAGARHAVTFHEKVTS